MSEEKDKALAGLFAESATEIDGAAFAAQVSRRIARRRLAEALGAIGLAACLGAVAFIVAPFILNLASMMITDISFTLANDGATYAAIPISWIFAGAVGIAAIVWARP